MVFKNDKTERELLIIEDVLKDQANFTYDLKSANINVLENGEDLEKYYTYLVTHLLNKVKTINFYSQSKKQSQTANLVCDKFIKMGACTTDFDADLDVLQLTKTDLWTEKTKNYLKQDIETIRSWIGNH